MKLVLLTILFSVPSFGLCLNGGGAATQECGADQFFTGGAVWGPAQQANLPLGSLRYGLAGAAFSYNVPATPGVYRVELAFVEPNKTAAGQRLFTVAINGQQTPTLDVFALAGGAQKLIINTYFAVSSVGFIKLDFKATAGNPMVSRIIITPMVVTAIPPLSFVLGQGLSMNTGTIPPTLDINDSIYAPEYRGERARVISPTAVMLLHVPQVETIAVFLNGLRVQRLRGTTQENGTDYTLDGSTITFPNYGAGLQDGDVYVDYGAAR